MIVMIFLLGALLGVLTGGAICVRYIRQELTADIGPKLRRIQAQLDNVEAELNLATTIRLEELGRRYPPPTLPGSE
jgi:hypothetical protein